MALVSNGRKNTAPDVWGQGPDAPLAHRRPGYSSSGCTPAEPDSASPGIDYSTQAQGEVPRTGDGREGNDIRVHEVSGQDRERDSGCIPGSDMAQCDAAGVNGSNRILSHGAPLLRMMPNGCLGSPVLVLLFGLDRGFLMDVGPECAEEFGLRTHVDGTGARNQRLKLTRAA